MAENKETAPEKKAEKNTGMAIVAYLLFFVPLLTDAKDDPFVKFHIKQSITLWIISMVAGTIAGMTVILLIGLLLAPAVGIASFVLFIIGIMNAANGEQKELPIIGKYAEQWFKF